MACHACTWGAAKEGWSGNPPLPRVLLLLHLMMAAKHFEHKHRTFNGPILEDVGCPVEVRQFCGGSGNAVLAKNPPRNPSSCLGRGVPWGGGGGQGLPLPRPFVPPFPSINKTCNASFCTLTFIVPSHCGLNGMHHACAASQRPHHGLVVPRTIANQRSTRRCAPQVSFQDA